MTNRSASEQTMLLLQERKWEEVVHGAEETLLVAEDCFHRWLEADRQRLRVNRLVTTEQNMSKQTKDERNGENDLNRNAEIKTGSEPAGDERLHIDPFNSDILGMINTSLKMKMPKKRATKSQDSNLSSVPSRSVEHVVLAPVPHICVSSRS